MPVLRGNEDRSFDAICPVLYTTVALTGAAEDVVIGSLLNPFGADFIIIGATVKVTAVGAVAGATLIVGVANTSVESDIIIDSLDITTATFPTSAASFQIADSITNAGTNGVNATFWRSTDYLTATVKVEAASAFRGTLHVYGFIA